MKMTESGCCLIVVAALARLSEGQAGTQAAETRHEAKWESLDKRPCPDWYLDAKFCRLSAFRAGATSRSKIPGAELLTE